MLGVLAGNDSPADDGILVDADQAAGLAHPTVFLQMVQHGHGFVVGQLAAVQRRALAFGETLLAGPASEHPAFLAGAVAKADAQVIEPPAAIVGAGGVLAAEAFQVVSGCIQPVQGPRKS
jgi:hypothetical protein